MIFIKNNLFEKNSNATEKKNVKHFQFIELSDLM